MSVTSRELAAQIVTKHKGLPGAPSDLWYMSDGDLDPWSTSVILTLDIAEELDRRGASIPEAWNVHLSPIGSAESDISPELRSASTDQLLAWGEWTMNVAEDLRGSGLAHSDFSWGDGDLFDDTPLWEAAEKIKEMTLDGAHIALAEATGTREEVDEDGWTLTIRENGDIIKKTAPDGWWISYEIDEDSGLTLSETTSDGTHLNYRDEVDVVSLDESLEPELSGPDMNTQVSYFQEAYPEWVAEMAPLFESQEQLLKSLYDREYRGRDLDLASWLTIEVQHGRGLIADFESGNDLGYATRCIEREMADVIRMSAAASPNSPEAAVLRDRLAEARRSYQTLVGRSGSDEERDNLVLEVMDDWCIDRDELMYQSRALEELEAKRAREVARAVPSPRLSIAAF